MIRKILILEKRICWYYLKSSVTDSDGNIYLTADYLIEVSNIIAGSNNIILGKFVVNSYRFDKMYIDEELVEDKLYQIIDQFNERQTTPAKHFQYF